MQTLPQPIEQFVKPIVFGVSEVEDKQVAMPTPLTEVEERLLRSIYDMRYLTIAQQARLHYNRETPASLNYVASIMKKLEEAGFVQRGYLARAVAFGRNPSVFRLATHGINHMAYLGLSPLPKFRPSDPFPSYENLKHTLLLNDVLIALYSFMKTHPDYHLDELRHDWVLQHTPVYVPAEKPGERKVAVIADAWLDILLPPLPGKTEQPRYPIHLELDRGTEDSPHSFKPKIAARVKYINGPYEKHFHTPFVTIAYATTRGNRRMERMRAWAEEELTRLKRKEEDSSLFYFTALPTRPDPHTGQMTETLALDPDTLFLAPAWTTPFDHTPKPLLAYD